MTTRILGRLLLPAALVILGSCSLSSPKVEPTSDPFMLRTPFDADRLTVGVNTVLRSEVTDQELSAACQSLADAVSDKTFGSDVIMADSPSLLRSAELLDGEFAEQAGAVAMETLIIQEQMSEVGAIAAVQDELGAEAAKVAKEYLDARSEAPSSTASTRYLVYLAQRTTTEMEIVRRSVAPLAAVSNVGGLGRIALRRDDGTDIGIEPQWCSQPD